VKVLEEMRIAPAKVVYVGNDMLNDIMPAKHAGFQTALFAGDKRSLRLRQDDSRCNGIIPDLVFTHLMELAELI
jgi:putative hydrolase of the HAD superfamily